MSGLPRWVRVILTVPLVVVALDVLGTGISLLVDRPSDGSPGEWMWVAVLSVPLAYLVIYGPWWVRQVWRPTEESHRHHLAARADARRIAEAFAADRRGPPPRPRAPRRW